MIELESIHGKRIAMIAFSDDEDATVFTGIADFRDGHLTMVRAPQSSFQIPDEWLDRLKLVPSEHKETLLDADYFFSVTIGTLSDGEDVSSYIKTGLKWPK